MGEEARRCHRSWEEEIYWTHFQCFYFAQFLRSGFYQRLAIPENFPRNLNEKLPDLVTLRSPGGSAWKVGLTINDDHTLFLNHGWTEFVKNHSLEENDFLIFKYNGKSQFDVLIFEGQSMCEKAASYFVRKCEHSDCGSHAKRKNDGSSIEGITASAIGDVGGSLPDKSASNDMGTVPLRQPIISQVTRKRTRMENKSLECILTRQSVRLEEPSACPKDIKAEPDSNDSLSPEVAHSLPYVSRRRPVTEEEKKNASQLAREALTDEGFIAVMKPSHVYQSFYMTIPFSWMTKHIPSLQNQDVILRFKENKWYVKFRFRRTRNHGWLSAGWKKFALDNKLHEFDVCVFEPGGLINNLVVLDVTIFRVVAEAGSVIPVS